MKNMRNLINGLVACGVALAMVKAAVAQSAGEGTAKVVRISGIARYMEPGANWQPLKVGQVLKPGTLIQTGKDHKSFVDIVLNEAKAGAAPASQTVAYNPAAPVTGGGSNTKPGAAQNIVRVWQDSALGIDKLNTMHTGSGDLITETQLDLRQGRITGTVKKMSAASKYEVKLPNGVAGIRGTSFDITADGKLKVYEGSVVIAIVNADGSVTTQVITAGNQYDAKTNTISPLPANETSAGMEDVAGMSYSTPGTPTLVAKDATIYTTMSTVTGSH